MMFKEEIFKEINQYVYRLIDPLNGETFYVGKGTNNRIFEHANGDIDLISEKEDEISLKLSRIRKIRNAGLEVIHLVHRHKIPVEAIFEVEAALIDAFPNLTNIQGGHGSAERGPMHTREIEAKYGLRETQRGADHNLLLININRSTESVDSPSVYECVRYAWKIDVARAKSMSYVLAVRRGIVLDAFIATEWLRATRANFPALGEDMNRWGFIGHPAPEEVRAAYRNTRLPIGVAQVRFPIRYWTQDATTGEG